MWSESPSVSYQLSKYDSVLVSHYSQMVVLELFPTWQEYNSAGNTNCFNTRMTVSNLNLKMSILPFEWSHPLFVTLPLWQKGEINKCWDTRCHHTCVCIRSEISFGWICQTGSFLIRIQSALSSSDQSQEQVSPGFHGLTVYFSAVPNDDIGSYPSIQVLVLSTVKLCWLSSHCPLTCQQRLLNTYALTWLN